MNLVEVIRLLLESNRSDTGQVVGSSTLVEDGHLTISLEVAHLVRDDRLVDGKLLVVGSDSVSVSIGVREESRLKDRVGGRLDTGDHVRWVESDLFDLGKVVLPVSLNP